MTEVSSSDPLTVDPQERIRRYNKTVREAQLVTVLLSSVKFDVKRHVWVRTREQKPKHAYDGSLKYFSLDTEKKTAFASVEWQVSLKVGGKLLAKCSAIYDVIYDQFSETDETILRAFVENVARPTTYAYFRALYASLDWAADMRSPPLPVIKFMPKV
jgi:hypothetical protein